MPSTLPNNGEEKNPFSRVDGLSRSSKHRRALAVCIVYLRKLGTDDAEPPWRPNCSRPEGALSEGGVIGLGPPGNASPQRSAGPFVRIPLYNQKHSAKLRTFSL
jgi:hypothetical protein